jgi:hypothetical protein
MSGSIRCPHCGHVLFAIDLPVASSVQARDVSPPDAPLLLRVVEAARLLGVLRSGMYQLVGSRQVPVVRVGASIRRSPTVKCDPAGSGSLALAAEEQLGHGVG